MFNSLKQDKGKKTGIVVFSTLLEFCVCLDLIDDLINLLKNRVSFSVTS